MEVLIVAKTHMRNAACVGGLEINSKKNVRLLNSNGENQPKDTEFEIGQVWDITYHVRSNLIPPHVEDVIIQNKRFIRNQTNISEFLKSNCEIWYGAPNTLFKSRLIYTTGQSGYITNKMALPNQSVGFWLLDNDLELTILSDNRHFFYFGGAESGAHIYAFPYVGFAPVVEKIASGNLVRISLARWWNPNPNDHEKRCYCQLSGWYLE